MAAQTELAEAMVAQQGLSGALKTDLNKLTQQSGTLTTELRSELENLPSSLKKPARFPEQPVLPAPTSEQAPPLTRHPNRKQIARISLLALTKRQTGRNKPASQ